MSTLTPRGFISTFCIRFLTTVTGHVHSHTIHHALALWALGADEEVLKASYKNSSGYQQPAFVSPEGITPQNFNEHLGDEK